MLQERGSTRTCIGCREHDQKSNLVRLVNRGGYVVVDESGTMHGRGAYLHRSQICFVEAVRRRQFRQALRVESAPDTSAVEQFAAELEMDRNPGVMR